MIPWPPDTGIVIPSYKSAQLLRTFLPHVLSVAPKEQICVVDDASEDGTAAVCNELGIPCLIHERNCGKGAALMTGFRYLIHNDKKWLITMDADGQHAPEDLHHFLAAARQKPSPGICIGARSMRFGKMPLLRIFSNKTTSGILSFFCGVPILDSQCGYRLYCGDLIRVVFLEYKRFEMESEVILKAAFLGFPITFVPIQTLYLDGPSHISHLKDTFRWIGALLHTWFHLKKTCTSISYPDR